MASPGFELLMQNLEQVGTFRVFLPLLLFIAIYFGLLKKTEAIGDDDAVIGVASIAMSFMTVFGVLLIVPADLIAQFFAAVALALIAVLSVVLIAGMVGFEFTGEEANLYAQLAALGVGLVVIFMAAPTVFETVFNFSVAGVTVTDEVWSWLVTFALIGVMAYTVKVLAGE